MNIGYCGFGFWPITKSLGNALNLSEHGFRSTRVQGGAGSFESSTYFTRTVGSLTLGIFVCHLWFPEGTFPVLIFQGQDFVDSAMGCVPQSMTSKISRKTMIDPEK